MNEALITLKNVGYSYIVKKGMFKYYDYEVLKDISFSIHKGETIGLLGRNGAGKSTLLKIIANILSPNKGVVEQSKLLSTSLLSLNLGFSHELSGRDNAIMGTLLLGNNMKQALKLIPKIIEFSGLEERIDDPLRSYSTGMQARLGFSVAIQSSPDILLVDEALGVGDAAFLEKSTKAMKDKMLSGQTVVFVSHNSALVKEICTRVIWLESGYIQMAGSTDEVVSAFESYILK